MSERQFCKRLAHLLFCKMDDLATYAIDWLNHPFDNAFKKEISAENNWQTADHMLDKRLLICNRDGIDPLVDKEVRLLWAIRQGYLIAQHLAIYENAKKEGQNLGEDWLKRTIDPIRSQTLVSALSAVGFDYNPEQGWHMTSLGIFRANGMRKSNAFGNNNENFLLWRERGKALEQTFAAEIKAFNEEFGLNEMRSDNINDNSDNHANKKHWYVQEQETPRQQQLGQFRLAVP